VSPNKVTGEIMKYLNMIAIVIIVFWPLLIATTSIILSIISFCCGNTNTGIIELITALLFIGIQAIWFKYGEINIH
jgi:hypothetical protein